MQSLWCIRWNWNWRCWMPVGVWKRDGVYSWQWVETDGVGGDDWRCKYRGEHGRITRFHLWDTIRSRYKTRYRNDNTKPWFLMHITRFTLMLTLSIKLMFKKNSFLHIRRRSRSPYTQLKWNCHIKGFHVKRRKDWQGHRDCLCWTTRWEKMLYSVWFWFHL